MSEFTINEDRTKGMIKDVVFGYVKLQGGAFKYQSTTEREWAVDCIVDKNTAKSYKKVFPKNVYKEIDTDEFEDKYRIKPPFLDQDEQFILKVKANANLRTDIPKAGLREGDEIPYGWNTRPKAFVPVEGGIQDITMEKLIANGSKGDVSIKIIENSYGIFPQLTGILVTELIEYEQNVNDSDFGEVIGGLNPGNGNIKQVATENEEVASNPGINDSPTNDYGDGIPF
jgi:hypothetical protein